jgi:hypothetical protein
VVDYWTAPRFNANGYRSYFLSQHTERPLFESYRELASAFSKGVLNFPRHPRKRPGQSQVSMGEFKASNGLTPFLVTIFAKAVLLRWAPENWRRVVGVTFDCHSQRRMVFPPPAYAQFGLFRRDTEHSQHH